MPGKFDKENYIDVQERINRFWSENPNGAIVTDVVYGVDFDRVIVRAQVFKAKPADAKTDQLPDATGIAAEWRGESPRDGANYTSWHENAETSAIGRALANMGYATSRHDRVSRQEIDKVMRLGGAPVEDAGQTQPNGAGRTQPAVPGAHDVPMQVADWSDFWKVARKWGITDMAALTKAIGGHPGSDAGYAYEQLLAWRKDATVQEQLA